MNEGNQSTKQDFTYNQWHKEGSLPKNSFPAGEIFLPLVSKLVFDAILVINFDTSLFNLSFSFSNSCICKNIKDIWYF